jgi:hypothetical protein
MNMSKVAACFLGIVCSCAFARATSPTFYTVDFASSANFTWVRPDLLPGAPTGAVTLGGVPFDIKSNDSGFQAWSSATAVSSGSTSLTVPVGKFGITDVYTLINTDWGQPGPTSYAWLVFTGSGGASYTDSLIGGVDIRDWENLGWTNTINGTTTVNVYNIATDGDGNPGRLDMQHITLPAEFATQTLVSVKLVDNGAANFQRATLDGITVESVPEPGTAMLAVAGALLALGCARIIRERIASR